MKSVNLRSAVACLIFAPLAWGGLFHVGKYALNYLDPYWFTAIRYFAAAIFLCGIFIVIGFKPRLPIIREHWVKFTGLGILGYGVFGIMVFIGLDLSEASHGAVIMATMPITSLFIIWLVDKVRPQGWAFVVALLALAGVVCLSGLSALDTSRAYKIILGDGVALLGTIGWVLYSRGQKSFVTLSALEYTAYTTFVAFPLIVLFASILSLCGLSQTPDLTAVRSSMPAMLYIVIFATVLSGLAYNYGVKVLGAHQGVLFINLVPVSAWMISMFFGVYPRVSEVAGTLLVVGALVLQAVMSSAAMKSKDAGTVAGAPVGQHGKLV